MKPVVTDWDDTLVHVKTQEWIDGAEDALRTLLTRGYKIVIASCRANWPEGRGQIQAKLRESHLDHPNVSIEGKPDGCIYIDNLGHRFSSWPEALAAVTAAAPPKATHHLGEPQPLRVVPPLMRSVPTSPPPVRPSFSTFPRRSA